jgi:hypothetical protein
MGSFCSVLFGPVILLVETASTATTNLPPWVQVATAIVTLVGLVIGIPYALVLLHKTRIESEQSKVETEKNRLESRKLRLEIIEKLGALGRLTPAEIQGLVAPPQKGENRQVGFLLLRFAMLYIVLSGWRLIAEGLTGIAVGVFYVIGSLLSLEHPEDTTPGMIIGFPLVLLIEWGREVLLLVLGLPLLRDINSALGFKFRDYLSLPFFFRRKNR